MASKPLECRNFGRRSRSFDMRSVCLANRRFGPVRHGLATLVRPTTGSRGSRSACTASGASGTDGLAQSTLPRHPSAAGKPTSSSSAIHNQFWGQSVTQSFKISPLSKPHDSAERNSVRNSVNGRQCEQTPTTSRPTESSLCKTRQHLGCWRFGSARSDTANSCVIRSKILVVLLKPNTSERRSRFAIETAIDQPSFSPSC